MKSIILITLTALSTIALSQASADSSNPLKNTDLSIQVQNTDEATIRKAAIENADQIRKVPNDLRAQGVEVSPQEETGLNEFADQLTEQASQPDFKNKVVASVKKAQPRIERAGMAVLRGAGYSGEAVLWTTLAPFGFGVDLVTATFLGRGVLSTGSKSMAEDTVGDFGGLFTLSFTYIGLSAIGFTLYGPFLASGLGVSVINDYICKKAKDSGETSRDLYCHRNAAIQRAITHNSARAGEIIGDGIHRGFFKVVHAIEYPFHDKSVDKEDDLGN